MLQFPWRGLPFLQIYYNLLTALHHSLSEYMYKIPPITPLCIGAPLGNIPALKIFWFHPYYHQYFGNGLQPERSKCILSLQSRKNMLQVWLSMVMTNEYVHFGGKPYQYFD